MTAFLIITSRNLPMKNLTMTMARIWSMNFLVWGLHRYVENRGLTGALIGGGQECLFINSRSVPRISFEIALIIRMRIYE